MHLVMTVYKNYVEFRCGDRAGSNPFGEHVGTTLEEVVDEICEFTPHDTEEIIYA